MPAISKPEPPPFLTLALAGASSSSSSSRRLGPALPLAALAGASFLTPVGPDLPFLPFGASSSSSGGGGSTTKRYLHLGQSIFLPTKPGSRMGTIASQLGHCCLKLELAAMDG